MAIQNGTTMSQKGKDQRTQTVAEITAYFENTLKRGEQLEERMLDEMIAKAKAEKANQTK